MTVGKGKLSKSLEKSSASSSETSGEYSISSNITIMDFVRVVSRIITRLSPPGIGLAMNFILRLNACWNKGSDLVSVFSIDVAIFS